MSDPGALASHGPGGPGAPGQVWRRFRRNRLAVLGLAMVGLVVVVALAAPVLAPYDPRAGVDKFDRLSPPSAEHWLGTDEAGRDVLSRVIEGSRVTLAVGVAAVGLALVIGVAMGALAGFLGGLWDTVVMRVADAFFAFPLLVGAVVIVVVVGEGVATIVLALGLFGWAAVARLLRGSILSVRESGYVEAARSIGGGRWWVVTRHVLPNSLAPVLVFAMVSVASAIVAEASLSYLNIGVPLDQPDWGRMISIGWQELGHADHLWLFPSGALVFTVLGLVFVGDGLRDALDPRLR